MVEPDLVLQQIRELTDQPLLVVNRFTKKSGSRLQAVWFDAHFVGAEFEFSSVVKRLG